MRRLLHRLDLPRGQSSAASATQKSMASSDMKTSERCDLLIVADATYSMTNYLDSLRTSLPQIISISALTGCFSQVGLLFYRDYCDENIVEWSGWLDQSSNAGEDQPDLVSLAKSVEPLGGGDYPEATKTALAKAYEVMNPKAKTVILLYTDAPPHVAVNWDEGDRKANCNREKVALSGKKAYNGYGRSFRDWVSGCRMLQNGEKKAQVFCILDRHLDLNTLGHYLYLSTVTGGSCIRLKKSAPTTISKVTVDLLLAWMGVEKAGIAEASRASALEAELLTYTKVQGIDDIKDEEEKSACLFFAVDQQKNLTISRAANTDLRNMTPDVLKEHLPKKPVPVTDFAKSYKTDAAYRVTVIQHLTTIINDDVRAMALNPVFGSLWRAVCNDRTNDAREGLISAFGLQVERIGQADEKAQMKAWLEESYDYAAEIEEMIGKVPDDERFPCVCLDPTLSFTKPGADHDGADDADKPITAFKRDELMEIGRSCDPKILRRLGRVLTRLTYIQSAADMPEHIASAPETEVPRIPMALANNEYGRRFWGVLLHVVLPGTMLSSRPAALLAALSLRLGVEPLTQAADCEMLMWRDKWNDINVPETWNVSCLSLLLDADQAYRQRQQTVAHAQPNHDEPQYTLGLLKDDDRALFEGLIAFKILERNLDTTLTARVGWKPEKTSVSIGPMAVCRACHYPRSVTIMGADGKCGHCLYPGYESAEARAQAVNARVSKDDNELTPAIWVECFVRTCRAQYVVYKPDALNVRPKCHFCRLQPGLPAAQRGDYLAPWVECTRCLNRMIWPEQYRPDSFSPSDFTCPPCQSGRETVTEIETTAKKLSSENTSSWLVHDAEKPDTDPFSNRSLYHTASTIGTDQFLSRIHLFPPTDTSLTLGGKLIRNPDPLRSTLRDLISHRRIEQSACSLCFSTLRPAHLAAACGRRGCAQRICRDCLAGWYGLNASGRLINVAALACPFCRRAPAARTLAKHGLGVHAVQNLDAAVRERGQWIYAWCRTCSVAKPFAERVCARGVPADLAGWECGDCREAREQRRAGVKNARYEQDRAKPCPGCGTMTERIEGCGHIACTVEGCGRHWCYFCGKEAWEAEIYEHMQFAHGGLFGIESDEETGDDEMADAEYAMEVD